jgi:TolB-like protein/DNA-binding SARP family transcriptional activator/tetratricopeptide (TPR) repeat protein
MHPSAPHRSAPRFRLITLGRLTLLSPDGSEDPSLGTRRRKLAVLAYLGLRERPTTRDHLAALFWGGKEDARARNSLSDAISHLRRVLGRNALVTIGENVALADDAPVIIDALALRAAVDAEEWTRAFDLYGGPLLDGVHIDDAVEFERWRSSEDARLRGLFAKAAAPHALSLAKSEQWEACSAAAARWLDAEPGSGQAALWRLKGMAAPGTSEALLSALTEYERLKSMLSEDLGVGMHPEVEQLVASLRAQLPPVPPPSESHVMSIVPRRDREIPQIAAARVISTPSEQPDGNRTTRLWRRPARIAAGLAAAITLGFVAISAGNQRLDADAPPVLAILPFENLGPASDAYFAEGITEEVRARLAGVQGLRVVGGNGVQHSGKSTKTPRQLARELGATHLLIGSVRWEHLRNGESRVRVSPELVRVSDQANVWATSVDGSLGDVFAIQTQVAEHVARALDATLHVHDEHDARPTANLAAYDAYLRGRSAVSSTTTFSAADRAVIRTEFERAISLDPQFVAAHTELAWSHLRDFQQAGDLNSKAAAFARFHAEARRAWELDSTQVDTRLLHAADLERTGDLASAARLIRETVQAAPGNASAMSWLAHVEWSEGKYEAAIAAERRAMELDPPAVNTWKGLAGELDRLFRYEEAVAVREREIELTPSSDVAYAVQASSHLLWRADTVTARHTLERGSVTLPWVVRLPGGVAGISIWNHVLPPAVFRARDTLTLAGYLAGAGGIAPELYHLMELRHSIRTGHPDRARVHAESLVVTIAPAVAFSADAPWFFWWFSRRSVLAEAYATLGRTSDAVRETDRYVAETRARQAVDGSSTNEQLCHALHNAAYVDVLTGRTSVAIDRLAEALELPCGHRVSRALLRADSAWAPLWNLPAFARLTDRSM